MQININIKKRYLVIFGLILGILIAIISGIFAYANWDSSKKVYHSADDVKVNISGVEYSLQEAINSGLIGNHSVKVSDNCYYGSTTTLPGNLGSICSGLWLNISCDQPNSVVTEVLVETTTMKDCGLLYNHLKIKCCYLK